MKIFDPEMESQLSSCRRVVFVFISSLLLILISYSNTFDASWHFDDKPNILNRDAIHLSELTRSEIEATFYNDDQIYRPFSCISLALNYYFGRTEVSGYHLVNISIHILACLFLYLFIHSILNLPLLEVRYARNAHSISLLAALLWALNPVQTQAVTYIIQRMASMAALFYIMSMYFYIKARLSRAGTRRIMLYLLCLVAAILATGSKENAAVLPLAIFLLELFLIRGTGNVRIRSALTVLLSLVLVPLLAVLILRGASTFDPSFIADFYRERPFSLSERLLTEPRIIMFYLSILFYPDPGRLSICHDISLSQGLFDPPSTILSIAAIVVLIVLSFFKSRRFPLTGYCIVFFFLNHLMESTLFPLELIFEHRNYLPSMLLFVPVSMLIIEGLIFYREKTFMKTLIACFTSLLLVGLAHGTYTRNFVWQNEGTLWADAAAKAPDLARPHNNLGKFYFEKGLFEKAYMEHKKALSARCLHRRNEHHLTYYNLGLEYQRRGETDLALRHYRISEKIRPSYAKLQNNIGTLLLEKGLPGDAADAFRKAIKADPSNSIYIKNLAFVLLESGRIRDASQLFSKALEVNPSDHSALKGIGYIRRIQGSYGMANMYFSDALRYGPLDPTILLYQAEIQVVKNRIQEARGLLEDFIESGKEDDLKEYTNGLIRPWGKENEFALIRSKKMVLRFLSDELNQKAALFSDRAIRLASILQETGRQKAAD